PNGKADRKALPEPIGSINTGTEYVEPTGIIERKLAKIWQEVLECDRVGVNDNFFELGGHSLKAAVLVSRIHKEFDAKISLGEIFKTPTIRGIAEGLKTSGSSIYSSILHLEEEEYQAPGEESVVYPASSAQKRLFILERMGSLGTTYNLPGIMIVEGSINREAFENAFIKLVKRHETLRTSFELLNDEPVQRVHKHVDFRLGFRDAAESMEEIIKGFIREFDLGTAPLFRAELVKIEEEKHLLMFDMHHIISDGVSTVILVKEFIDLYRGANLPELRIQYRDYAIWQNKILETEFIKKQQKYWLDIFSGEIPVLNMPQDYSRPSIQSYEGDRIAFTPSKGLSDGLRAAAENTSSTLYMVLLAAYNILLHRYTGQEDIIVGSPTAGRPHADLESLAGMFVNTLALRNYPKGGKTFSCFLKEVRDNVLRALENQDYQFEKLIDDVDLKRDLSRNPLFDTMFVLQNMGIPQTDVSGLKFIPFEFESKVSKFDITLEAVENQEGIRFNLEYCTRLFKRETIERLACHFEKILEQVAENPDIEISQIEMLTEEEKNQILFDFNNTKAGYPMNKTIPRVFEEQVERMPHNTAVIFEDKKLTYSELNRRANSLARV
ncbi:MAG: condensation domain-containing protein, partial [Bacillota bacterium]